MMEPFVIQEAVERIGRMEQHLDVLQNAVQENPAAIRNDISLQAQLQEVTRYYESGQWLRDYELDETGLLPQDLKRGILAQDTLYDFLGRFRPNG